MLPDEFYTRRYDSESYHCAHFARDVWLELTGEDIGENILASLQPVDVARVDRKARHRFRRIQSPVTPCLVTVRRPGTGLHMGVYIEGNLAQLTPDGVTCFSLDTFPGKYRFYK